MKLRKLTASVAAGVMAATALAPAASAGQLLGQMNFDDGIGLPWHTCETAPGDCDFAIEDGVYKVIINNPGGASRGGEDRWDVQFRHRGLTLISSHSYTIKFDLTATNSGKFYTKLGNLEGNIEVWHNGNTSSSDFGQKWDLINVSANQTYSMNCTFTPTSDATADMAAEWAFHLGGDGQYTSGDCFPVGTTVKFDNMSLIDNTSSSYDYDVVHAEEKEYMYYFMDPAASGLRNDISVNQMGYYTNAEKYATLILDSDDSATKSFEIHDESGNTVYTGTSKYYGYDEDSYCYVHILDFSDFATEGAGYTISCDGKESFDFGIGDWIYDGLLDDSLNYFYLNRSAIEIKSQYVTSGDANALARKAGHTNDVAHIQTKWSNEVEETGNTQNVTGGWYDAGDYGKYVVNGGISLWTLQNEYEMAVYGGYADETFGDGTMSIPENSNGYPDLLDECAWEMDWFMTMEVKSGTQKGMVYHKVHDEKWTALGCAPADYEDSGSTYRDKVSFRVIKPATLTATFNAAACAAQAARLWADVDATKAAEYLEFAKRTYAAGVANYVEYSAPSNPDSYTGVYASLSQNIGGGPYGDTDATDEAYWAAAELFITTQDDSYYTDMTSGIGAAHHLKVYTELYSGEDAGTIGFINWGNTSGLGIMSLFLNKDVLPESDYETLCENLMAAADVFRGYEDEQGFGIPIIQSTSSADTGYESITGYPWGSNHFVVNNAMLFAYAFEASYALNGEYDSTYFNGATMAMDYIFGRNPLDFSYVSGYGDRALLYPHHRYWAYLTDPDKWPKAPAGCLSGGPNSTLQDPWVAGYGWGAGSNAPQLSYTDNNEAWSVNEITINWNSPLAWVIGYLQENCDKLEATEANILWGDINCDGIVNSIDATLATRYAMGITTLTDQGLINGDVNGDGIVNSIDATIISRYVLKVISSLPV